MLGREQIYNPQYSVFEKVYIRMFGMPIVGLRIRGRNVFSLIPQNRNYNSILDAGSGTGVFTFELARRYPATKIVGVDMLEEQIDSCRFIARTIETKNVEFEQSSVEELSNSGKTFDLIVCVDILEHIDDDDTALQCLGNLLTPNGILILHVPALYRRYPVWQKRINFDVASHMRPGYELQTIRKKVYENGMTVHSAGYTYGFFETLANNLSYMITRARMENKLLYAIAFPFLNVLSLLGAKARPRKLGAGIFILATSGKKE